MDYDESYSESCYPDAENAPAEEAGDRRMNMLREDGWSYEEIIRGDWRYDYDERKPNELG